MRITRERMALIGILLFGTVARLWKLGFPKGFVFDEVYYVDGARDYLSHLVEMDKGSPEFVVHPPLGKWLIAIGIRIFGDNEFGWRIMGAIVGVLSIYLIYLVALNLFKSEFIALGAALLTSLDGIHLVMSRTALLDIFLMFFVLASFYFLLERKYWLLGISLGAACATKWSALFFIIAFLLVILVREVNSGYKLKFFRLLQISATSSLIYISSWFGWFISKNGWDRSISSNSLISLWKYHIEILNFHTGLTETHSYSANPWSWLILGRPTSFFYSSPKCGGESCSQEILALGTPLLWWTGTIAIATVIGFAISKRSKIAAIILISIAAGYLPWFAYQKRTVFSFYSIVFEPFLILAIMHCIKEFLNVSSTSNALLKTRQHFIYGFYFLIGLCFLYFLPIFIAQTTSYDEWHARMWFSSWI